MMDGEEDMSYDEDEEDYKYEEEVEEEEDIIAETNAYVADTFYAGNEDEISSLELGPRKLRRLERQVSYQVHPVHSILANQKVVISEISEMLGIPHHDSALLLRNYKWDKETACDAWWSEQTSLRIKIGLPATVAENLSIVSCKDACILCHRRPIASPVKQHQTASMCSSSIAKVPGPTPSSSSTATATTSASGIIVGTKAVNRDVKQLLKQNLYEIEFPNEDNIFEIDLIIKCEGDWEGIEHKFRAKIPPNYPFSFPTITCLDSEKAFHPNIQPSDGSICLGILTSEEWKAMYTLTDICAAISGMFRVPNWDHSLNQEAFELFHDKKGLFYSQLKSLGATGSFIDKFTGGCDIKVPPDEADKEEESGGGKVSDSADVSSSSKKTSKKKNNKKNVSATGKSAPLSQCIEGVKGVHIDELEGVADKPTENSSHSNSKLIDGLKDEGSPGKRSNLSAIPGIKVPDLSSFADQSCESAPISETTAMLETFVAQNKAANYCPAPGCNRIVEYQKRDKTRIITCDCGSKWCWGCKREPHAPVSCKLIEQWDAVRERLMSSSMSDIWLAVNVKTCPSCKKRIWKDGGCMHVTCKVGEGGCGAEFCWLCLDKWSTHGQGDGGYYACNKYLKGVAEGTLEGEAKSAHAAEAANQAWQKEGDRYHWHYERHLFMLQSRKMAEARGILLCTPQCAEIAAAASSSSSTRSAGAPRVACQHGQLHRCQQAIEKALQPIISNPPSAHQSATVQALAEANDALVICRDVLRWIYVAKYFFDKGGPLEIFQSNHDALESHTEKLNRMIEKDWTRIAESAIKGKYKANASSATTYYYELIAPPPPSNGGIADCGLKIDLSPSELYDQLRLLRDTTSETLRFMTAISRAREFEEHFGF